jgi:ABC-type transporter Mla MlaB component
MLRTMITETPFEQKWVLQGRLCRQWAADLKERWDSMRSTREGRKCSIDLEDVTSVDAEGENVLLEMAAEGAALFATRAYMKHILESLHESPRSV